MISNKEYLKWYRFQLQEKEPDLSVLEGLISAARQYLESPDSEACHNVFLTALEYSEKWIKK